MIQEKRTITREAIVWVVVRKKNYMDMCIILNGDRDIAISVSRTNLVRFLLVGLDEGRSLQKKSEYTR
jgi:hypothetical protein